VCAQQTIERDKNVQLLLARYSQKRGRFIKNCSIIHKFRQQLKTGYMPQGRQKKRIIPLLILKGISYFYANYTIKVFLRELSKMK
jgi:hypothetical protein